MIYEGNDTYKVFVENKAIELYKDDIMLIVAEFIEQSNMNDLIEIVDISLEHYKVLKRKGDSLVCKDQVALHSKLDDLHTDILLEINEKKTNRKNDVAWMFYDVKKAHTDCKLDTIFSIVGKSMPSIVKAGAIKKHYYKYKLGQFNTFEEWRQSIFWESIE